MSQEQEYDVIVVGTGHAGCEAALAAARMGARTAIFTLNLDNVALMPCNPSIGGPGKGHLVREIDALGGEMARNTDRTSIQIRMLNTSKGPAVQALRAQSDKRAYSLAMKQVLEEQPGLDLKQGMVEDLILEDDGGRPRAAGVIMAGGAAYGGRTVILTTGTFLKGRIIVGEDCFPAGRAGEFPADKLSSSLAECGFEVGRLKTGTPPRLDGRTIDYDLTERQPGSAIPLFFSFDSREAFRAGRMATPSALTPIAAFHAPAISAAAGWREQLDCYAISTNGETHEIIRRNLHRAPMYNGGITSAGPRYCPSIETKIVRFAAKGSHPMFLEPEGWHTREMYLQGANTSLPEDVQLAMVRSVPALRRAEIMRAGYAIEYDYLPGTQVYPSLEAKPLPGLFLAGQIIGTTGYEEAAALGIMAGINAARQVHGEPAVVLGRDQAYIGVLIDDLVTRPMDEPYRMHTSQAEFRLLLRQDNADARLTPLARSLGLVDETRHAEVARRQVEVEQVVGELERRWIPPSEETNLVLSQLGHAPLTRAVRARDLLCRNGVDLDVFQALGVVPDRLVPEVVREIETMARYSGYVERQSAEVARLARMEGQSVPAGLDYAGLKGVRSEARERLAQVQPRSIGQARRVAGVTPSDIAVLLVHLERERRQAAS